MASTVLLLGNAHAQSYAYTDLNAAGSSYGYARSINNLGQIVGAMGDTPDNARATLWSGGIVADLGSMGGESSDALSINDHGQIVGFVRKDYNVSSVAWQIAPSGSTALPAPSVPQYGYGAEVINNSGQIAGSTAGGDGNRHATIWTGNTATVLDQPGWSSSYANGINDQGAAVGYGYFSGGYIAHATLWNGNGMSELAALGGSGGYAYANAINNSGQVVGASQASADGNMQPVLWDGNHAVGLDTLGGDGGEANAINNRGQIVGTLSRADHPDLSYATLWDGKTAIDLNQFLDSGARAAGWVLFSAKSINDQGWIVGAAVNTLTNEEHAYLLSISDVPEPSTYAMLMLGLGLIGLARRRRR